MPLIVIGVPAGTTPAPGTTSETEIDPPIVNTPDFNSTGYGLDAGSSQVELTPSSTRFTFLPAVALGSTGIAIVSTG